MQSKLNLLDSSISEQLNQNEADLLYLPISYENNINTIENDITTINTILTTNYNTLNSSLTTTNNNVSTLTTNYNNLCLPGFALFNNSCAFILSCSNSSIIILRIISFSLFFSSFIFLILSIVSFD